MKKTAYTNRPTYPGGMTPAERRHRRADRAKTAAVSVLLTLATTAAFMLLFIKF